MGMKILREISCKLHEECYDGLHKRIGHRELCHLIP